MRHEDRHREIGREKGTVTQMEIGKGETEIEMEKGETETDRDPDGETERHRDTESQRQTREEIATGLCSGGLGWTWQDPCPLVPGGGVWAGR